MDQNLKLCGTYGYINSGYVCIDYFKIHHFNSTALETANAFKEFDRFEKNEAFQANSAP